MIKNEEQRQRIGNDIATLRTQKGMTQQDIADRTGQQRNHISRIEHRIKIEYKLSKFWN